MEERAQERDHDPMHVVQPDEPMEEIGVVAGARGGRTEAGGDQPMPETVRHVVEPEGAAERDSAVPAAVVAWLFRQDEEPRRVALSDLPAIVSADENFVWIDLSEYAERDLRELAALLALHHASVHIALSAWKRPRLDMFKGQFFVTATIPHLDAATYRLQANQLDLFVGRNYLVSAHRQPLPFADRAMSRVRGNPELVRLDSAFMLYIMLDELLEYYEELNEELQAEIETMEERALVDTGDKFLQDLLRFKRYAFAFSQLANQHREVFAAFVRPDFPFVSGDEVDVYYRDLEARLSRLVDALLSARDAVNGAFDIYVSHVSHRTNKVMKVLTMVSTVLLPTTVIIALFSTSIQGVPYINQPIGFIVMLTAILMASSAILLTYHRKGWF